MTFIRYASPYLFIMLVKMLIKAGFKSQKK